MCILWIKENEDGFFLQCLRQTDVKSSLLPSSKCEYVFFRKPCIETSARSHYIIRVLAHYCHHFAEQNGRGAVEGIAIRYDQFIFHTFSRTVQRLG